MDTQAKVNLSGPADVVGAVPYLLGFHPERSVILINMVQKRLSLVQRVDIPTAEGLEGATANMVGPMGRAQPDAVLLLGYEAEKDESRPLLDALCEAAARAGAEVRDVIVVRKGRWRSLTCQDPTCCPPEGREISAGAPLHKYAEFVGQGRSPLASREALTKMLEPTAAAALLNLGPPKVTPSGVAAWAKVLAGGDLDKDEIRAAGEAVHVVDFRDAVIAHMCPGQMDPALFDPQTRAQMRLLPPVEPGAQERLVNLCANLADRWAPPALCVLATYAWWCGSGAVARVALERTFRSDQQYSLGRLLEQMIDTGVTPKQIEQFQKEGEPDE